MSNNHNDDDKTQSFIALTKGLEVGHYRIIEKIGAGGMGEVYLAEDTQLDRRVALKFLPPHLSLDEAARERFTREAKAAAKLDHPNIVQVFEVGEFQGRPFFAMAHIEGKSLREVIKEGKLSINEAMEFTKQICEGLHKAHEAGVVHRDIKPSNIIIDGDNKARILDFGLATVAGEDKLTKTGSTLGTVGYMSPEQIEGKQVDHRSDLFSVGVILYEMLTGRRPFEGDNDAAVARSITDNAPEPIARYKSGTTGELQQIIDKVLAKDSSIRYQHADGMLADLKRLQMGVNLSKKRRLGMWIAMAAVGLVAIATYFANTRLYVTSNPEEPGWSTSIAVLVFRDLSPDREQEFLCSGIADDIIGRLATIQDLKVSSFQSTARFIGTDIDRRSIGTELGVDHILAGSLQLLGEDLRVRVELFRVNDDVRLWSNEYKQNISSIFGVQSEIASTVASVLGVGQNNDVGQRRGTDNIEAYNAYVRGDHFFRYRNADDLRKALGYFREAVSLDSTYALGWLGLYNALHALNNGWFTNSVSPEAQLEKKKALENAIWFGEGLAEIHALKGMMYWRELDYEKAESEFLRAIDISPGYVWAHIWYANMLGQQGNQTEQAEHRTIALELDPVSSVSLTNNGWIKFEAGDFDAAKKLLEESISIDPKDVVPYWTLSRVMLAKGDTASALATLNSMFHVAPDFWRSYAIKAEVLWLLGEEKESQELYNEAVKMAPDIWQSHNARGDFLLNVGMPEEAVNAYRKALKCVNKSEGRSAIICGQLARAFETAGHTDSALQAVERGLDLAPDNEDLLALKQKFSADPSGE